MNQIEDYDIWEIKNICTDEQSKYLKDYVISKNVKQKCYDDPIIADYLWNLTKDYLNSLNTYNFTAHKCHDCVSVGHHTNKWSLPKHYDFDGTSEKDEYYTKYMFVIYLNDDMKGGGTVFYPTDGNIIKVKPEKNKMVLFNLKYLHSGDKLEEGEKYFIGTTVVYKRM